MLELIRKRFAAKLTLLIAIVFLIPVVTSLVTIVATSKSSLDWFAAELHKSHATVHATETQDEHAELEKVLGQYEKGRTATLVITLVVVSFVLSGVVILLSMLILKRGIATLAELSLAAEEVGRRNFNLKIIAHSNDEFGELAHAFQTMVEHLKATTVAKELAEESSRLRSEFLANMSHEIRTPLNGILGLADVLAEEETDEEKRKHLRTIDQCGRNLLHLINEILELSKLEAGRMVLRTEEISLTAIIHEATATVQQICRQKGVELKTAIDPKIPDTMITDGRKLVQTLINLLGNAAKFTDHGSICLRLSPNGGAHRGDILFSVSDTGPGIAADRLPYIFESFVQAQEYLTRPSEGTGLGLSIARKLVDLMGGEIWVESSIGKGTTVSFTIRGA